MKRTLYLLALLVAFSSCRSVNKMIENGDYESAIYTAQKRLKGDKKKSTKNVKYLEEAYAKILKRDLQRIQFLTDENKPENFDRIYRIYEDIQNRQNALEPLLPLVSKSGYYAEFNFIKVNEVMGKTAKRAAEYHYDFGKELLGNARKGHKFSARKAFDELAATKRYFDHYKDVDELLGEALHLGKTRVLVTTINRSNMAIPVGFEDEILNIQVKALNDQWTEYFASAPSNLKIDVKAEVQLKNFDIGPEREFVREFVESKEIEDGFEYFYDSNGNVAKDTLGNDIKKQKYKTIFATITEIKREKAAMVGGFIKFNNESSNETLQSRSFTVESIFDDFACHFSGDRRAISANTRKHLKNQSAPFPNDHFLVMDAAEKLKVILMDEIKRFVI